MAAPQPSFARTLLTHGLGFGVFLTVFSWARDAFECDVPPWPSWAFVYGLVGVLGGFFYGGLYWWLDRRSARRG